MLITRKADYALRMVDHLARRGGGPLAGPALARAVGAPESLAGKVLQQLQRAGIVASRRGVSGGYRLAREPAELTVLEVVEAVQGPLKINVCVTEGFSCERSPHCAVHPLWADLRRLVEERLRRATFSEPLGGDPAASRSPGAAPAPTPER